MRVTFQSYIPLPYPFVSGRFLYLKISSSLEMDDNLFQPSKVMIWESKFEIWKLHTICQTGNRQEYREHDIFLCNKIDIQFSSNERTINFKIKILYWF